MQETDMKEKLQKIIEAYDELQAKMGDPAVLADQKEYNRLAKEYASQGPLAKKAAEYVAAMDDLEAAKEMLSDADMKEFAQEEIASIEGRLPQLEEDIKFMLIPADPADEKDIIVEIRAAAGGDEAAIFAGDLYKMYERFAAAQGWKTETMDASPSEAGGFKEIQFKVKGSSPACTVSSASPRPSPRGASIPPRPPWPSFPRPTRWKWRSTRATCASTCTAPAARAVSA